MLSLLSSLHQRLSTAQIAGLFLLLVSPVIFAPFMTDDYFHLLILSGSFPERLTNDGSLWGLFSFIDDTRASREFLMSQGALPWWTSGDFYFRFWRPLAEITHQVDFVLFTGNAVWAHLHNILWFLALVMVVYRLVFLLSHDSRLAFLACLVFLIDGNHAAAIGWVASRNAIMAACFASLCLYNHILYRQRLGPAFQVFALFWLLLALLSAESSLAIGFYLFAYALFLDKQGFTRGFMSLLPYALLVAIWYWQYQGLGYGANGSSIHYVDAMKSPLAFLLVSLERVPVYLASALWVFPAEMYPALKMVLGDVAGVWVFLIILSLAIIPLFILYPLFRKHRLMGFALCSGVLSFIPMVSVVNQDRLVLIPSIAFALVIALLVTKLVQGIKSRVSRLLVASMVVLNLVLSPVLLFGAGFYIHHGAETVLGKTLAMQDIASRHLLLLQSNLTHTALIKPVRFLYGESIPDTVSVLSNRQGKVSVERISESGLKVTRDIGFVAGLEQSYRSLEKEPYKPGDYIPFNHFHIIISKVNLHGQPLELEVYSDISLESEELLIMHEDKKGFHPIEIPAIGHKLKL